MIHNKPVKELEPVILKITPTILKDYSSASCIGDTLNKILFGNEKEAVWRVMPWYDEEKKTHFCYELLGFIRSLFSQLGRQFSDFAVVRLVAKEIVC